ncbi:RsmB/NOP family class I SAM-dependent RNA methyltransferase [Chitinophaga niabensis]|uniref:16S rRNA (Cytosine967-C5)-methyltransferase n=1 Tax=Chitinophaga niabensis TaxID=536979 RepID=A0A1N6K9W5_9BACT|nr:RsmB/NOP family class I SAM-dependent RNA methyltransferase [Chitinophaga niabensis]SIO53127.1 16S rRNA (cytosine967-C5)-methyltransferase [Chitinophaga niabensis]
MKIIKKVAGIPIFANMTRWENYIIAAEKIITGYNGSLPLHHYLKTFFKAHPHMGSRDRKRVQQLVYHFFRLGNWEVSLPLKERILLGTFLCEQAPDELLTFFKPEWNVAASFEDKLATLGLQWDATSAFPFAKHLSAGIDAERFTRSFLQQPKLFLRARPGKLAAILRLLEGNYMYEQIGANTIALPNGTKTELIIPDKSWYEVQDLSSQETGFRFHPKAGEHWWDCCAASGGKSILLHDLQPAIHLFASDVRASILENLRRRFAEAGLKNYSSKVLDLTSPALRASLPRTQFSGIILDAPCSGSGTWGRTPESITFFKAAQIKEYATLQKQIARNVAPFLAPGGTLVYITCSVFREENEEAVAFLEQECGLKIEESGIVSGYERNADTMFVAVAGRSV